MESVGRITFCFALVLILLTGLIQCRGGRGGGGGGRGGGGRGGSRGGGRGGRGGSRGGSRGGWTLWRSSTISGRPKTSLYTKSIYSGHRKTVNSDGFGTGRVKFYFSQHTCKQKLIYNV